jgi:hypothetical protein
MSMRAWSVTVVLLATLFVADSSALAQEPGVSGKWKGVTVSSLGDKANVTLEIEELNDGTITGTWDGRVKIEKGERVTAEVAHWELTDGDWRFCCRCAIKSGGKALTVEITATTKEAGKVKGYTATSLFTK